jgi:hypothetical protein
VEIEKINSTAKDFERDYSNRVENTNIELIGFEPISSQ